MIYSKVGDIPVHQYGWVKQQFITDKTSEGLERCIWFGIVAYTGRAWGCNIMLESGAVYREVPIHALRFKEDPINHWPVNYAQHWDCYGIQFSTIAYKYLYGLDCKVRCGQTDEFEGRYLFTTVPIGDAFSEFPDQAKEFVFALLDNGCLTVQPTNRILFKDKSFTVHDPKWPTHLRPLMETYHSE